MALGPLFHYLWPLPLKAYNFRPQDLVEMGHQIQTGEAKQSSSTFCAIQCSQELGDRKINFVRVIGKVIKWINLATWHFETPYISSHDLVILHHSGVASYSPISQSFTSPRTRENPSPQKQEVTWKVIGQMFCDVTNIYSIWPISRCRLSWIQMQAVTVSNKQHSQILYKSWLNVVC